MRSRCVTGEVARRALVGSPGMPDLGLPDWEATWPQRRERRPRFVDPYYLHYSALVGSLAAARDRYVTAVLADPRHRLRRHALLPALRRRSPRSTSARTSSRARTSRYVCPVEQLEIPDASFDVVLCTQVLEHSRDPAQALREITRVLRPGGHAFVTTHGIWPFHPYPVDLWRWTQQGLETIVGRHARARSYGARPASRHRVRVRADGELLRRRRDAPPRPGARSLGRDLGAQRRRPRRRSRASARYPNQDTLIHNFLVVCSRDGASS